MNNLRDHKECRQAAAALAEWFRSQDITAEGACSCMCSLIASILVSHFHSDPARIKLGINLYKDLMTVESLSMLAEVIKDPSCLPPS